MIKPQLSFRLRTKNFIGEFSLLYGYPLKWVIISPFQMTKLGLRDVHHFPKMLQLVNGRTQNIRLQSFTYLISSPIQSMPTPYLFLHYWIILVILGWPKSPLHFSVQWLQQCLGVFNFIQNNFVRLYCDSCHIRVNLKRTY